MEMPKNNILSNKGKETYQSKYFKTEAYDTLTNYTKNLIKEYISREQYPFPLNPVIGMPYFEYAHEIKSDQELLGRIKALGQILGIEEIEIKSETKITIFDMNGTFTVTDISNK